MGVRGDFRGLSELRAKVREVASARGRTDLCRTLAEVATKLIDDEFRQSRDPYGNKWLPLKHRKGQPLRDTGNLLNSLAPKASETGFTVSTAVKYAGIHQYGGTVTIPPRANAHAKTGRFLSRSAAGARKRAVRISFSKGHQVTIPQRQYMPEGELGPIWSKALLAAAEDFMRTRFNR